MKGIKIVGSILVLTCMLLSSITGCKKESSLPSGPQYAEGWIRVIGVKGTDTSTTKFMQARSQTDSIIVIPLPIAYIVLTSDEDDKLRAELVGYTPLSGGLAQYTVRMINKQPCQMILRWNWQNLAISNITPPNDVLAPNEVKVYVLTGKAIAGKILVKAEKSNSDCPNSSTLTLEITNVILPIEFTNAKVDKKGKDYLVTFSTETPQDVDGFYIMWSPTGKKEDETIRATADSDPMTKDYKVSFPRIKVEDI